MKKQIAKTISILSLFVILSVGASRVSAAGGCAVCKPVVQSVAAAQTAHAAPVQVTSPVAKQPDGSPQFIALLWLPLARFFASLL